MRLPSSPCTGCTKQFRINRRCTTFCSQRRIRAIANRLSTIFANIQPCTSCIGRENKSIENCFRSMSRNSYRLWAFTNTNKGTSRAGTEIRSIDCNTKKIRRTFAEIIRWTIPFKRNLRTEKRRNCVSSATIGSHWSFYERIKQLHTTSRRYRKCRKRMEHYATHIKTTEGKNCPLGYKMDGNVFSNSCRESKLGTCRLCSSWSHSNRGEKQTGIHKTTGNCWKYAKYQYRFRFRASAHVCTRNAGIRTYDSRLHHTGANNSAATAATDHTIAGTSWT